jgi:superfamily I DNA/RNA helicase
MTDALSWAGTFHGIGARLLQEYAEQIGLDTRFTIHDREDSADLMNIVRHEQGLSNTKSRFPAESTCLAIYFFRAACCRCSSRRVGRRSQHMPKRLLDQALA